MQLSVLKPGTQISAAITIQAALDAHHGIANYLATDKQSEHYLLHFISAKDTPEAIVAIQRAASFARENMGLKVDYGSHHGDVFYAEPFPLGEFMFEWLERKERISTIDALKHCIKLLKLLIQAHDFGITHGRITPKTVLFEQKGFSFHLRLMGLGIAQALPVKAQQDIDWFDYVFDLEGMSKAAVDIYGMAIILLGLVSGENGIDAFEATGLLPQALRGGQLQQAMERALALRIEAYQDILSFCKDLEVALLELDAKQGEMYVGDLVGFEAAIRSIAPQSEEIMPIEGSGVWSAIVDPLKNEERSSLLQSLTSLQAIRREESADDDEVTSITAVPQSLHFMRRIRSKTSEDTDLNAYPEEKTQITAPPKAPKDDDKTQITVSPKPIVLTDDRAFEDSKSHELFEDEEDDAPTRIMLRPNYASVSQSDLKSIDKLKQELDKTSESEIPSLSAIRNRIMQADITTGTQDIGRDFLYPTEITPRPTAQIQKTIHAETQITGRTKRKRHNFTKAQSLSLILLIVIIIALLVAMLLKI